MLCRLLVMSKPVLLLHVPRRLWAWRVLLRLCQRSGHGHLLHERHVGDKDLFWDLVWLELYNHFYNHCRTRLYHRLLAGR